MISHFAADNGRQMRVNALSSQRGAEGCWKTLILRDVRHHSFFPSLLFSSTHSLWNSNLGMTNRVITFTIDVASFELQMRNLHIWLVRIRVSGTMEKQIWGSSRSQIPHADSSERCCKESCAYHNAGKRVSHSSRNVFFCNIKTWGCSKCSVKKGAKNKNKSLLL